MAWIDKGNVKLDSKGRVNIKKYSNEASGFQVKTKPNGYILLVPTVDLLIEDLTEEQKQLLKERKR